MESSFPPTVTAVTAVQVGNFFVGQYYQVLQQQPDFVHQFYTEASRMTRIDGPVVDTATAMLQIHSLIMSLNFTSIEIKTAHSMDSWNSGVLVVVSGSVQVKEFSNRRKFAQTFFLAPQEKGYFVLNDIFQFFDEEQPVQHPATMIDHGNYDSNVNIASYDSNQNVSSYESNANVPANPEPVLDYVVENDVQGEEYVPAVYPQESESVDKYSIPEPTPEIPEVETRIEEEVKVEEPSSSYSSLVSPAPTPAPTPVPAPVHVEPLVPVPVHVEPLVPVPVHVDEPPEEPVKHTYASILRSKAFPANPAPQSSLAKPTSVASEWDQPPQQPSQSVPVQHPPPQPTMVEKPSVGAADETSAFDDEGEVTSVYVRNLPPSASASELEQEFRNFGRLKPEGVLIKSRKEAGVYYAFVEFEDISGVQNAVKASPISYHGRQIYVEERRPSSIASRGRRGRGRGGYQFDGARGGRAFGGRTFGRGTGQDNMRDYSSRARGNGIHQPRPTPRQERGILGSQGMRNGQNQYDA